VKTVETHVSNVLRKLQLSSRHELTRWAAERRMI
jgi:DNA-binding NarL/FixJ family response regulator